MKNDKKVEKRMKELKIKIAAWCEVVEAMGNQNASTDTILENVCQLCKEIYTLHNENFTKQRFKLSLVDDYCVIIEAKNINELKEMLCKNRAYKSIVSSITGISLLDINNNIIKKYSKKHIEDIIKGI